MRKGFFGRRSDAPVPPPGRRVRLLWAGGLVVVGLLSAAAWWALVPPEQRTAGGADLGHLPRGVARQALNLLVITLDTTRADRLGAYGATDVETPVLDELAREGVVFDHTMASAPLTLPAHCSIFTGRFPPEHGVRDNGGFFLQPDQTTLAEVLQKDGFQTGAVVAAYVLDSKWGLDQGFGTYIDDFDLSKVEGMSLGSVQRPGNEVVDKALPWLEKVRNQRFFAWLHFYDPHTPYDPPEPFKTRYAGHPYNGEIAFVDQQVGRVIDLLRQEGVLDKTIVVVIGDHGESLGEHGEEAHGFFIYESATRVPFIVRAPFSGLQPGRHVADPVRSVDVVPTVLDLLGLPPLGHISGRSLVPLLTGAARTLDLEGYAEAMYPLHHYGWSELVALRAGRYKLIDAPRPELYDLDQDPHETTNLFDRRRALGDTMITRLRAMEGRFASLGPAAGPSTDVDPDVRARLAALGYVGSFVATAASPKTGRADPKDKIELFNMMTSARDASKEDGSSAEVVAMLRKVVAEDPNVIDAWFMLGNQFYKEDKYTEAIEYFKRALALKPDYDLAIINMANSYRRLGDDSAALAGYEHYLRVDPKNAYVRYQVGEIYLDRDDIAQAESNFRQALSIDPKVAPALNALGVIAFKRHDLTEAERQIREALVIKSDVRLAHYNLALVAEERGDTATAEAEYRRELELHPTAYKAAYNLGMLYGRLGNRSAQIASIKQSIDINKGFAEGYVYLAKAYLDGDTSLDEALSLARKGIEIDPASEAAPLGHFVIGQIMLKRGDLAAAERELEAGRAAEARLKARGR